MQLKEYERFGIIPAPAEVHQDTVFAEAGIPCGRNLYAGAAMNDPIQAGGPMDAGLRGGNWDEDYRQRGRLYGGAPIALPPLPAGSAVLELGCGEGKSLASMLLHCWQVAAIDSSPRAVYLARRIPACARSPDLATADAAKVPFRDQVFDAVFATHVLGHADHPGRHAMAREICRVLRPGGTLWFRDFSVRDFRFGSGHPCGDATFRRGTGITTHYFTEEETSALFSSLVPLSVRREEWALLVRGRSHLRSEIAASFRRPPLS